MAARLPGQALETTKISLRDFVASAVRPTPSRRLQMPPDGYFISAQEASATNRNSGIEKTSSRKNKKGPSLGNEGPERRIPFPAFFSPGCGVIHPSFPLRGRWE